jgi:hypothetical protein
MEAVNSFDSTKADMVDTIYNLAKNGHWEACMREIPTASPDQISYASSVRTSTPPAIGRKLTCVVVPLKMLWTALHIACSKRAPLEAVRLLIENGADVNARDGVSLASLRVHLS